MKRDSNPFNIFREMPQFAEKILREVSAGDWFDAADFFEGTLQGSWPLVDIFETDDEIIVKADVPGLKKPGDISIELKGNNLFIEGEVPAETETGMIIHKQERPRGKFSRVIIIPAPVNAKNIRAVYQQGTLEIKYTKVIEEGPEPLSVDFIK